MRALTTFVTAALLASTVASAENPAFKQSNIDWSKAPAPAKDPTFKPPVAKRAKLKNGINLLVIENHTLPIVAMELVVLGAGPAADPKGKGGLAGFTADMLDEGAGGLSALGITEETERLGAELTVYTTSDTARVNLGTLAKSLDASVDLMTKVVTQPAFEAKELERVKGDRVTSLELRRDRPREVAQLMLDAALYGADSAYGHSSTVASVKPLAEADVKTFYKERWAPKAMTLVVAGDVDLKTLKTKLDATLGAWKPTGGKAVAKVAVKAQKLTDRLLLVDRQGAAQSDVRIGMLGIERKDKRFYQMEVLQTVLGGSFTSRLNNRLRETLGITYGIRSAMGYRASKGTFVITSAIVTAATAQGIDEISKLVDGLTAEDIPAAELAKGKQNLIRQFPATFDTNAGTVDAFSDLVASGLPDSWYATYAANVGKVTAKQVRALAKSAVQSRSMVISIVGDMTVVKPELDKLSLGSARMHDLYGAPLQAN